MRTARIQIMKNEAHALDVVITEQRARAFAKVCRDDNGLRAVDPLKTNTLDYAVYDDLTNLHLRLARAQRELRRPYLSDERIEDLEIELQDIRRKLGD